MMYVVICVSSEYRLPVQNTKYNGNPILTCVFIHRLKWDCYAINYRNNGLRLP